jgi:hypothetical protein
MSIVLVMVWLLNATASAHHSFLATYSGDQTIQIDGKVISFLFRDPHAFIRVSVKQKTGKPQDWSAEWGPASQLRRFGVTAGTVNVGDVIRITGNPGRVPADHRIRLRTMHRDSDGYEWGNQPAERLD